ncbi:MAG: magnesium transporter [Candidatus Altiarchaeota archaeon]
MTQHIQIKEKYAKNTAGRVLTSAVLKATPDEKISEVYGRLERELERIDILDYVYVVDNENKLIGVFSFKEFFSNKDKLVREVMKTDIISASPHLHQEKVAHKALRHNLRAIPITEKGYFLGVVPYDKILSIINKEAHEDFLHFGGIHKEHMKFESILEVPLVTGIKHRLPWLLIGLIGGIFAAKIIGFFEKTLEKNLILAAFIPLVVYISDAVGTQIETVYVRDLSILENLPMRKYMLKHLTITIALALIFSSVFFLFCFLILNLGYLSFVISLSIFVAISLETFIALVTPYILKKFNFDPAIGSGPFTTIVSDVTSVIVYFLICSSLL